MAAQGDRVCDVLIQRGLTRGEAEAATVETDDPEVSLQTMGLGIPHLQIECPPVHEHDGWTRAFVPVAKAGTVGDEIPVRRHLIRVASATGDKNSDSEMKFV